MVVHSMLLASDRLQVCRFSRPLLHHNTLNTHTHVCMHACTTTSTTKQTGVLSWWLGLMSTLHAKPEEWSSNTNSFVRDYFSSNWMPTTTVSACGAGRE